MLPRFSPPAALPRSQYRRPRRTIENADVANALHLLPPLNLSFSTLSADGSTCHLSLTDDGLYSSSCPSRRRSDRPSYERRAGLDSRVGVSLIVIRIFAVPQKVHERASLFLPTPCLAPRLPLHQVDDARTQVLPAKPPRRRPATRQHPLASLIPAN